jgi:translation initiation factor RLI1
MPRPGQVLGLVGTNGIGKSTALKILAGKCKPNLGRYDAPPDWQEILSHFRGSELQNYFTRILEDNLKVTVIQSKYCQTVEMCSVYVCLHVQQGGTMSILVLALPAIALVNSSILAVENGRHT